MLKQIIMRILDLDPATLSLFASLATIVLLVYILAWEVSDSPIQETLDEFSVSFD
jgi:hypothetical protein